MEGGAAEKLHAGVSTAASKDLIFVVTVLVLLASRAADIPGFTGRGQVIRTSASVACAT